MSGAPRLRIFGRALPPAEAVSDAPDWQQANPLWIAGALQHAQALPRRGWTVVGASREVRTTPRKVRLSGRDYVVWRSTAGLHVAPEACPHLGASLHGARTCEGEIVCPWHGLRLGPEGHGGWRPLPTFDDGVLLWTALHPDRYDPAGPLLPERPDRHFDAVIQREARCEPEDILANRLDPWHGAHYHPYAFGRLKVIEQTDSWIVARVVYRVGGPFGVEVDARFDCPDPDTIVMRIVAGEGEGSVVETHATRIEAGRTRVIEATLATSERPQFWRLTRSLSWVLRPLVRFAAQKLWVDDAAYAERRYALRRANLPAATSTPLEARNEA